MPSKPRVAGSSPARSVPRLKRKFRGSRRVPSTSISNTPSIVASPRLRDVKHITRDLRSIAGLLPRNSASPARSVFEGNNASWLSLLRLILQATANTFANSQQRIVSKTHASIPYKRVLPESRLFSLYFFLRFPTITHREIREDARERLRDE